MQEEEEEEEETLYNAPTEAVPAMKKPPTLASLVVDRMDWIETHTDNLNANLEQWYVRLSVATREAQMLAYIALGSLALSILINICMLVLLALVIGHMR